MSSWRSSLSCRSDPEKPPPVYTSTCIAYVTKTRSPDPNAKRDSEYIFVDGLQCPLYCDSKIGNSIPDERKIWSTQDNINSTFGKRCGKSIPLPKFSSPCTVWGLDMTKPTMRIIPYNIEFVWKQQKNMGPIAHFIQSHPEVIEKIKPQIVCNRFVLKRIISMTIRNHVYSFIASKINGVIYLREIHKAMENSENSEMLSGAVFESAILTARGPKSNKDCFDLNESTYGIYTGRLQNITILFSAEIDGFWSDGEDHDWRGSPKKRILGDRVVEVKTLSRDYFQTSLVHTFRSKILNWWSQCFLIGLDEILFGIVDDRQIAQLQVIKMYELKSILKGMDGYEESHKTGFCTRRLYDTLNAVVEEVIKESPTQYLVTATHIPGQKQVKTCVSEITSIAEDLGFGI